MQYLEYTYTKDDTFVCLFIIQLRPDVLLNPPSRHPILQPTDPHPCGGSTGPPTRLWPALGNEMTRVLVSKYELSHPSQ